MAMLPAAELDLAAIVETGGDSSVRRNGLDHRKATVRNSEGLVLRGELNAVADGEIVCCLPMDADPTQPPGRGVAGKQSYRSSINAGA
jgi:hypothetical protein